jgi:hypothetical protein
VNFFNIAKMPKKPFWLRSVLGTHLTHIKYAKKMKKFDRELFFQNQKMFFRGETIVIASQQLVQKDKREEKTGGKKAKNWRRTLKIT